MGPPASPANVSMHCCTSTDHASRPTPSSMQGITVKGSLLCIALLMQTSTNG